MEQNAPEQEEVDLIEYLNIFWERRWFIIIPTVILALIAGVVSFLLTPVWEVDAVIQPSKFFFQDREGKFTEVIVVDPRQIVSQINQQSYQRLINARFNLDPRKVRKVKAENPQDTKLVRVSIETQEIEKGKAILNALFEHIKAEMDRKIDVEMKSIATQIIASENNIKNKNLDIQSKNIDIDRIRQAIISAGNKVAISEGRSRSLVDEMKGVKIRIDQIEEQQKRMLAEKKEGNETLGLLLYSNEIQQNFRYYNTLEENLSKERISEENLRHFIRDKEQEIKGLKNQIEKISGEIVGIRNDIEFLVEKKQRIDYAILVKEPTVSLYPVFPKKTLNVAVTGFLGLICFSILALFLDAIEKRNIRLKTES